MILDEEREGLEPGADAGPTVAPGWLRAYRRPGPWVLVGRRKTMNGASFRKVAPPWARVLGLLLLVAAEFFGREGLVTDEDGAGDGAAAQIVAAYRAKRGNLLVEGFGTVQRTLPDDDEGSRHQRFILDLSNGHTVLVAHNIDVADRVPLAVGDRVGFRREFEWNDRGGVLHWTHHDPGGRHVGGWLERDGQRYE